MDQARHGRGWPPKPSRLLLLLGLLVVLSQGSATQRPVPAAFNAIGPLYPVVEQDLLSHIEGEIAALEQSGELGVRLQGAQRRAMAYVREPAAVKGLTAARRSSSQLFDPSVALAADVIDAAGNVLHPAGTRVNPLAHVELGQPLLFFDERDTEQLQLARQLLAGANPPLAILVGGSPIRFAKQSGARPYFDQAGALSRRLKLSQVPALVSQQGLSLRIDVIGPKD